MSARTRFSANVSMMFGEYEPLDRINAAARAGFEAVEFLFPYEFSVADIRARLSDSNIVLNHLNTRPGETFGLAAQPGKEDEFARVFDQALDYATRLGALTIHCMSGVVAQQDRAHAKDTFLRNMRSASAKAQGTGVTLVIEPINIHDRDNFFVQRSDDVVALLRELACPNVRLLFDFYHIQIMEGDLTRRLDRHWDHIGHFQFASVPLRHEPDTGEINLKPLFAEIVKRGWSGFLGAEYRPAGRTEDGLGWLQSLACSA
jgi:hydroxypyruvate isomerase